MRRVPILAAALALCACLPGAAWGATRGTAQGATRAAATATMTAAFAPYRLGAAAAVSIGFQIATDPLDPALLKSVELRFPANLGIATSGLGMASCEAAVLEAHGPSACPPDSRMGSGSALVQIPIGPELVRETATLGVVAGPSQNGYVNLLVSATGLTPVIARIVLSTVLQPGRLRFAVPPIQSLPEAPYVAVVRMRLTLGGNLIYYERVHGRNVPYSPVGIGLPRTCPRGGFRFAASFGFQDGGRAQAQTAVPCPRRR